MNLLVLAGGFGTRLKSAVADVPKALAPVGEVPFLRLQIENWRAQGLNEFTFLLHHQANQIINFLQSMQAGILKGCQVNWLIERTPLDTGGAIAHAVKELSLTDDFLMTNADTWLGGGIRELTQSSAPSMAVVHLPDVSRYGKVHFDQYHFVTAFVEKNVPCSESTAGWINAGLCHLHADLFKGWSGRPTSLERDLFATLVQHRSLKAVPLLTEFIDIGIPSDYQRYCRWAESDHQIPLCN